MKRFFLFLAIAFLGNTLHAQYTEQDIYRYIDQYQELAIRKMHEYGIPASITIAQGIFESACGTSRLATNGNNHFGIKCHKEWEGDTLLVDDDELGECFRRYTHVEESFNDHSLFLTSRPRYQNLFTLDIMDYKGWAKGLKAAGYATNPQYADRLIRLIERYNIARLDTLYIERDHSGYFLADHNREEVVVMEEIAEFSGDRISPVSPSQNTENAAAYGLCFTAKFGEYKTAKFPFSDREVYENNKSYFVICKEGDSFKKIAQDVQDTEKNIRKYNDAKKGSEPQLNEVVYIENKAKNNPRKYHTVRQGETLRFISQKYAVQLHYLFKYNNLNENSVIHPGDQIKLKN